MLWLGYRFDLCKDDRCQSDDEETCNEWWENKGYDEKRKIWKEHNDC